MISKKRSGTEFSDIALNLGAILLALSSAAFAILVVLLGPQATLNKEIIDSQISLGADESIITGSLGSASKSRFDYHNSDVDKTFGAVYRSYSIRSIDDGIATIDFFEETTVRTIVARVGDYVDGIGFIKKFVRKDGFWYALATTN